MGANRIRWYKLDRYRDQRRDKRMSAPVFRVLIEGQSYDADNWSLGGVRLIRYDGRISPEGTLQGIIVSETANGPDFVRFDARVLRFDPADGSLALAFLATEERLTQFLERNIMRRLVPVRSAP